MGTAPTPRARPPPKKHPPGATEPRRHPATNVSLTAPTKSCPMVWSAKFRAAIALFIASHGGLVPSALTDIGRGLPGVQYTVAPCPPFAPSGGWRRRHSPLCLTPAHHRRIPLSQLTGALEWAGLGVGAPTHRSYVWGFYTLRVDRAEESQAREAWHSNHFDSSESEFGAKHSVNEIIGIRMAHERYENTRTMIYLNSLVPRLV